MSNDERETTEDAPIATCTRVPPAGPNDEDREAPIATDTRAP